jgi:nucleoside-diphosphate-sugar epimerase
VSEQRIVVTGAAGLIGSAVTALLRAAGTRVSGIDIKSNDPASRGDFRDAARMAQLLAEADGVLHFAAVSRVIDGERDPETCWSVNAEATGRLLEQAAQSPRKPWVVYASSREVYGQQDSLPVNEDAPLKPKNVYARSKVEAERLMDAARAAGHQVQILRFSNVYGETSDHADRVVPAFARAAASAMRGEAQIRVDGSGCTFDFTHVADVADGVMRVVKRLRDGARDLPPIHFVSGQQTSLGELAQMAVAFGGPKLRVTEAPARGFDVSRFAGDPRRAETLLGWRATTPLQQGFARLAADFRNIAAAS